MCCGNWTGREPWKHVTIHAWHTLNENCRFPPDTRLGMSWVGCASFRHLGVIWKMEQKAAQTERTRTRKLMSQRDKNSLIQLTSPFKMLSTVPHFNLCSAQNATFLFLFVFVVLWRTHQVHLSQVELGAAQSLPALPPQGAELHGHLCRLHSGEHFLQDGQHLQRQKKTQNQLCSREWLGNRK